MKYLSREWLDAVTEKSNTDKQYLKKAKKLTIKFQILVTDTPGGVDKLMDWYVEKGMIKSITLEEKPAPSNWRTEPADLTKFALKGTAPYATNCALHKGELPLFQAMTKGFKMDGDLMAIMGRLEEYLELQNLQATIPAEY